MARLLLSTLIEDVAASRDPTISRVVRALLRSPVTDAERVGERLRMSIHSRPAAVRSLAPYPGGPSGGAATWGMPRPGLVKSADAHRHRLPPPGPDDPDRVDRAHRRLPSCRADLAARGRRTRP